MAITNGQTASAGDFITTSSGSSSAGKVAKANSNGVIDVSFIPPIKFGGTGADGALSVTSGTTTLSAGSASILRKNYTSISISSGATLAFSNPGTNGTIVFLKSQGTVAVQGTITMAGMGPAGGAAQTGSNSGGNTGTAGLSLSSVHGQINPGQGSASGSTVGTGGAIPTAGINTSYYANFVPEILRYGELWVPGSGGSGSVYGSASSTSGAGAQPCGSLVVECAGALNFTGTINAAGVVGGSASGPSNGAAGGGGSAPGALVIVGYNTLTANSGTINVGSATGGVGWMGSTGNASNGGGAGATLVSAGSNGTASGTPGTPVTGGAAPAGVSIVFQNTMYA